MVELSKIVYAFLGFMLVFVGLTTVYSDFIVTYNIPDTGNYSNSYNRIQDIYNMSQEINQKTVQTESSVTDAVSRLLTGVYSAMRIVTNIIPMIFAIISDIAAIYGIPNFIVIVLMSMTILAIVFAIIVAVLRGAGSI